MSWSFQLGRLASITMIVLLVLGLSGTNDVAAQEIETNDILIDPLTITTKVHLNGSATLTVEAGILNLSPNPVDGVDIRVDSLDIAILSASAEVGLEGTSLMRMERHTMVSLNFAQEIPVNESVKINMRLSAQDLQSSVEENPDVGFSYGSMTYYMRPHSPVANFTFVAILPDHSFLMHDSVIPLYPESDQNFTDGDSMAFVWYNPSILPGQESVFIVRYKTPMSTQNGVPISAALVGLVGALGVIGGLGVAFLTPKVLSRLREISGVQFVGSTREESTIVEVIKSKGGSCSQQELYRQLDISESKLSLLLGGLEERGVVKRVRTGRENRIHLVEVST